MSGGKEMVCIRMPHDLLYAMLHGYVHNIFILESDVQCWQAIEKVKVDKADKPYQDVKILNVTVPKF